MATESVYDGSIMRLYVDDAATDSKKAIGYALTVSASFDADTVDRTHKDNASGSWREVTPKTLSGSINFEALWSQTAIGTSTTLFQTLYALFKNKTKITWAIKTGTTGDYQLVGYGYVTNLSPTATDKEDATFSGTITVTGEAQNITIT